MQFTIKLFLFLFCLVFFNASATEIKKIRFGKTEQRSRLVIESDEKLIFDQHQKGKNLVIVISEISRQPSQQLISASALSMIKTMSWNKNSSLFELYLPINTQQNIKTFQLNADKSRPFRLIVDLLQKDDSLMTNNVLSRKAFSLHSERTIPINKGGTKDLKKLIQEAKEILTDKNYPLAISKLTRILKIGSKKDKAFAIEFLGVARERNYQLAFAKQYYQRFINEYPESPSLPRVKQRLASLIGIQEINKKKYLSKSKRNRNQQINNIRGSIAVDYRTAELINDLGESRKTLSLVGLEADIRGSHTMQTNTLSYRFSAGHYQDFLDSDRLTLDRLRYANVNLTGENDQYKIAVGRQRSRGKGIFNRFDGVLLSYKLLKKQTINLVVGAPVASSKVLSLDPERSFLGLSYDWEDMFNNLDASFFFLHQSIGNLTDRQAIGTEIKYIDQGTSIYSLIDFDIFYSELNAFLISGSHTTKSKTRYHWSYNIRKSPYISTRNALIGQPADSLKELQSTLLSDEEILDLAADRTLESQTSTLQISQPINPTFDISGSLTWTDISGAPASGGVAEIVDFGKQLYFNLYLTGSHLYSQSDSNQIGFRQSKLSQSDVQSIYISSQYRWKNGFSLNGKLRYDTRKNNRNSEQQSISPSFRLQYQKKKQYFYADIGAILYTNKVGTLSNISTDIYYAYLGYRYYF